MREDVIRAAKALKLAQAAVNTAGTDLHKAKGLAQRAAVNYLAKELPLPQSPEDLSAVIDNHREAFVNVIHDLDCEFEYSVLVHAVFRRNRALLREC